LQIFPEFDQLSLSRQLSIAREHWILRSPSSGLYEFVSPLFHDGFDRYLSRAAREYLHEELASAWWRHSPLGGPTALDHALAHIRTVPGAIYTSRYTELLSAAGERAFEQGNREEAIGLFRAVCETEPAPYDKRLLARACELLGRLYSEQLEVQAARDCLERASGLYGDLREGGARGALADRVRRRHGQ
jgi:tetratricopeptide (TPR) repeat protein